MFVVLILQLISYAQQHSLNYLVFVVWDSFLCRRGSYFSGPAHSFLVKVAVCLICIQVCGFKVHGIDC